MKFEKFPISEELKENLIRNGFHRTTDIQFKAIPPILNGEDVLAIAQTGSGKTAAFAIPIIQIIHQFKTSKRSHSIKCLVMVPTRELAKQIGEVFAMLSRHTKASSFAVYGGVEQDAQIRQLEGGIDVLIATPGRMFDLIRNQHIDISGVSILVLDEADRMLDLGFIDDIKKVKHLLLHKHQTLFFSATINPKIKKLAYSQISSQAMRIQISPEKMVSKNITHSIVQVEMDQKRHLLVNFINEHPDAKLIVFVRTQVRADRVMAHLEKNNIKAIMLHGGMEQIMREENLDTFRNGSSGVLIATDVTARGIDLPGITHVINYDLPDIAENYVHRIGRTGRGFAKGTALSFYAPEEQPKLQDIEEFLNTSLTKEKVNNHFLADSHKTLQDMSISEMIASEEELFGVSSKKHPKKNKK